MTEMQMSNSVSAVLKTKRPFGTLKHDAIQSRVRALIDDSRLTRQAFAARLSISHDSLKRSVHGRRPFSLKVLLQISEHCGVRLDWLLLGRGTKRVEQSVEGPAVLSKALREHLVAELYRGRDCVTFPEAASEVPAAELGTSVQELEAALRALSRDDEVLLRTVVRYWRDMLQAEILRRRKANRERLLAAVRLSPKATPDMVADLSLLLHDTPLAVREFPGHTTPAGYVMSFSAPQSSAIACFGDATLQPPKSARYYRLRADGHVDTDEIRITTEGFVAPPSTWRDRLAKAKQQDLEYQFEAVQRRAASTKPRAVLKPATAKRSPRKK